MSQINNFVDVKNQIITVPVNSNVANYQTKVFFNGSNARNLRSKIITSISVWTNSELSKIDGQSVVDASNSDFSTYLTLVGINGKRVINQLPLVDLYNFEATETSRKQKQLRQFLMKIDWEKSYFYFVWSASPVAGSTIAIKVSYVDSIAQLPDHVKRNFN